VGGIVRGFDMIKDFLQLVKKNRRANYFVVCPPTAGLGVILRNVLDEVANTNDLYFEEAKDFSVERARVIARQVSMRPVGGSNYSHVVISNVEKLPLDCVGPLLKAVEESVSGNFYFQASSIPSKVFTLASRSMVFRLPFLTKAQVYGNLQAMGVDVYTLSKRGLYDGTLLGSMSLLANSDIQARLDRAVKMGGRGLEPLLEEELLDSLLFPRMVAREDVRAGLYLEREDSVVRRRFVALAILLGGSE